MPTMIVQHRTTVMVAKGRRPGYYSLGFQPVRHTLLCVIRSFDIVDSYALLLDDSLLVELLPPTTATTSSSFI